MAHQNRPLKVTLSNIRTAKGLTVNKKYYSQTVVDIRCPI